MVVMLFIIVMTVGGYNVHIDFRLEYSIHKAMFLGNLTRPTIFGLSFQWLGMSCSRLRVVEQLVQQLYGLLMG